MIKTIHKLLFVAIMFAASSCITDEIDTGSPDVTTPDGNEVVLRLKTPGGFSAPKTRGLDYEKENTIDDIYVMVFDDENELVDIREGEDVGDKTGTMTSPSGGFSGGGTFSVALPQIMGDGNEYKLVVLANAGEFLSTRGFTNAVTHKFVSTHAGDTYSEVVSALYGTFTTPLYGSGGTIPMWGEVSARTITPSTVFPTISMKRALARIDVGVGQYSETSNSWNGKKGNADILFALKSVHVVRPNDRYALIPNPGIASTAPTVAGGKYTFAGSNGFNYPVSNNRSITYGIYVPEANIKMGNTKPGNPTNHTSRMAIVVGGEYNNSGSTTYYRLDFADTNENLVDVLRNHLYRFSITGVDGPGYSSVQAAYNALSMNMTSETEVLDETKPGNVVFDNQYYIAYDPGEFTFEATPDGSQTLNIETDYPGGWTVSEIVYNGASSDWLTPSSLSGTGDLSITAQNYTNTSTDRTAYIHITAGRMTFSVSVRQERYEIPVRLAAPGVIGYRKSDGQLTLKGSKEYGSNAGIKQFAIDNFGGLEEETVYVAYFKFGSLVAIGSGGDYDPFDNDDIISVPEDLENPARHWKTLAEAKAHIGSTWSNVPVYNSTDWTTSKYNVSDLSYHIPSTGKGDPCMYYFGTKHGGGWKLPTGHPYNGSPNYSTTNFTWKDIDGLGTGTPAGRLSTRTGEAGMFYPAAGLRTADGTLGNLGTTGYYLSSTAHGDSNVSILYFARTTIGPDSFISFDLGFSVRCIRQ